MVKDNLLYLFIGQDASSKDVKLSKIKQEILPPGLQDFNLDVLYARELNLKGLQEKLLLLPLKAKKRIVVVKDALSLKEDIKTFILKYIKMPKTQTVLILDVNHQDAKDGFLRELVRFAQVYRFGEPARIDTFALSRQIEQRKPDYALRLLNQLLKNGEKPERIMGGLRYAWERDARYPLETKKRLKLLLNCDIDIKRGRLSPNFALERLVISLCGLRKP